MVNNWGIIFDRDGTLIKFVDYISKKEDVQIIEGMSELLHELYEEGAMIFLHTNQSAVGRGIMTRVENIDLNNYIIKKLDVQNIFSEILIAYGNPEKLSPHEKKIRKPTNYFSSFIKLKYKIKNIIYVGDTDADLQSAIASDCFGIGVRFGKSNFNERKYAQNKKILFVSNVEELRKTIYAITNF